MRKMEVRSRRRLLDDFFKVDEAEVSFERFDGSMTPPVRRLVFERGDSVAAVVFDRDAKRLLLTEQFRFPAFEKGPGWLIEIIAGMIDRGEQPEDSIRREIEEELGYRADRIEHVATFYVSPGGSSERIWVYYTEVREDGRISAGGGLAGEHEDIRLISISPDEARAALQDGTIVDAKTIIGLQWFLARQR
ncbi:MAG TPA: NUDIX hydrolase [Candidatus Binatia bacterium]|nr:NUDIX hydrolase [Candidatus Binatia bacterium]